MNRGSTARRISAPITAVLRDISRAAQSNAVRYACPLSKVTFYGECCEQITPTRCEIARPPSARIVNSFAIETHRVHPHVSGRGKAAWDRTSNSE